MHERDVDVRVLAEEGQHQQPRNTMILCYCNSNSNGNSHSNNNINTSKHRQPAHLAGADDGDLELGGVLLQVPQAPLDHELHGRAGDGDRALADLLLFITIHMTSNTTISIIIIIIIIVSIIIIIIIINIIMVIVITIIISLSSWLLSALSLFLIL